MRTRIARYFKLAVLACLISFLPLSLFVATGISVDAEHQQTVAGAQQDQGSFGWLVVLLAPAEAHAAGDGDYHGSPLSAEKLKDLFWRTVNFLVLVFILVKFLAKPIASGLKGRQQRVKEELEELTLRRDEAEQSYKDFEIRLAGMEKEMEIVVQKAIAQAENEKERILAEAERAAQDIRRQAEAAVQAEFEDAKRQLRDEIAEQAAAMAEELIIRNLKPADQVAITEQYLERVGAVQ
ncbi:ATP synthase F0 subunit B [Desulfobulbus alkaliphilus]|uniref:ATP synthase F0 subunit B n=1 Tax=Desulfobulbus alkaliphilus TaxID=869814 RepID=UPI0019655294|nr:ATP synthase F0 subunit B [Desulfobulbus alkaliphilus]MBM9537253.1 ATP synthase F0 subunit B [Desulfobulbus alkaliphilus]